LGIEFFCELEHAEPRHHQTQKILSCVWKNLTHFYLSHSANIPSYVINYTIMNPEFLALSIIILLFSVIIHEVMHGVAALKFGDRTALNAGRLTLNPIPHIDPVGTILLPILLMVSGSPILFGWAKPVPINPLNFSNIRKGELFVSAAGIASNFGLAVVAALIYHLLNGLPQTFPGLVGSLLHYTVIINLVLGVFNLFPIPPLDGSKILLSQLPYNLARSYQKIEPYGFLILLILLMVPFGGGSFLQTILGFFVGIFSSLLGF